MEKLRVRRFAEEHEDLFEQMGNITQNIKDYRSGNSTGVFRAIGDLANEFILAATLKRVLEADKEIGLRWLLFIRDHTSGYGLGERYVFRYMLRWMAQDANKRYINFYRDNFNASLNMPLSKDSNRAVRLDIKSGSIFGLILPCSKDEFYENQIGYIEYSFTCKNDSSHVYLMFISVEFNNGEFTVRKVGQNPSMLTVKGFDFDKYKKQLDRINAYEDYKKADLSNADHFYVGAHAYLRRIFEKLINWYVDEYNVKLSDDRMKTKIDSVKQYFDPRINKLLKNLYSILSVSIHELDEDESKDYYSYLKAIIDMQLEYEYTEEEKAKQSSQLSAVIGKIESSLKKKKK